MMAIWFSKTELNLKWCTSTGVWDSESIEEEEKLQ